MAENTEAKKDPGLLIVQSKVRDLIREKEMRTSDEFISALSEHVRAAVEKAVSRAKENGRSTLCVRDNGLGIDAEHLDKIFDPFYTTKDVGQGMGLGLSICYRIVQEAEGRISVKTEPGKFCEFTLEFPVKG